MLKTTDHFLFFPRRQVLYILATLAIGIFCLAFFWFIQRYVFLEFQQVGQTLMTTYNTESTTSNYVDVFFTNAVRYLPAIALIGLAIWAWQYSQKKGQVVYE